MGNGVRGVAWIVAAGLAAGGCGGTAFTSGGQNGGGGSGTCNMQVTGSVSGTADCTPAATVYAPTSDVGAFTFAVAGSATQPAVQVRVTWSGAPTARSYTSADSGAAGNLSVTSSGGRAWSAVAGDSSAQGSYVLRFSSVAGGVPTGNLASYVTHGSLNATLTPDSGSAASGNVILTAVF